MTFERYEDDAGVSKSEFRERAEALRVELLNAQSDVAEGGFRVLMLVVGDDRAGCEEVTDRLHEWLDARGIDMEVFLDPGPAERQRPAHWRYWQALPAVGRIGVFLGAWAYDFLADHAEGVSAKRLRRRVRQARALERLLLDEGTLLLRYWIHTPRKVLKRRLREDERGEHGWHAAQRDREVVERYDEVVAAGEELVEATDLAGAPWTIVSGIDARGRDLAVLEHLRDALLARLAGAPERPAPDLDVLPERSPAPLAACDLSARLEEDEYGERLERLQARMGDLAYLASERGLTSVLVFEGPDAAGKGGAVRRITRPVAARDYRVVRIAAPTDEERSRPFLWRFWRRLPRRGRMGIFDRSWYGRVLVERVEGFATPDEWQRAYGEIVEFERQLVDAGWLVLKFWLHIDPDEQLRRFEARRATPYKKYKLTPEDLRNRAKWDAYVAAANEMVLRTDLARAPWHVVPANDKRHARCAVLEAVVRAYAAALED